MPEKNILLMLDKTRVFCRVHSYPSSSPKSAIADGCFCYKAPSCFLFFQARKFFLRENCSKADKALLPEPHRILHRGGFYTPAKVPAEGHPRSSPHFF